MDTTPKSQKILNSLECCKLDILLKMKLKVSEIPKLLCRDRSTIYREINQGIVKFRKSDWSVKKEYRAYY